MLLAVSQVAAAETTVARNYALPGNGSFSLDMPASWKDSVKQPQANLPPTIEFGPAGGAPFQVLVTPIPPARPGIKAPTADELRAAVRQAADQAAGQAVEKMIELKELKGGSGTGYYFSATDRAPAPGEFKRLTQGMLAVRDARVTFTILTNDGQDDVVKGALQMLAGSTLQAGAPDNSQSLSVESRPDAYVLTVPVSRLTLTIPKGHWVQHDNGVSRAQNNPRYFYFTDSATNQIVSGWFESDRRFRGIDAVLKETGGGTVGKSGGWDTVAYDIPIPKGTSTNVRAEWVEAGTWIDLHLSVTTDRPVEENRRLLQSTLAGFTVTARP